MTDPTTAVAIDTLGEPVNLEEYLSNCLYGDDGEDR